MKFLRESSFWYFLAHRALEHSSDTLVSALGILEDRATELALPIHYPREHASAWAVLLQLFEIAGPYREVAGRWGYEMMLVGFDHVFGPKGFSEEALSRLLGNFRSPALPDRTRDETIVDTFLANAMKLTDETALVLFALGVNLLGEGLRFLLSVDLQLGSKRLTVLAGSRQKLPRFIGGLLQ
ncbi:MAG: hypothetical protein IIB62_09430, partial [Proteobacteria bacterium]|nr:hypothetical protein [Pseudomonadota bacterium]